MSSKNHLSYSYIVSKNGKVLRIEKKLRKKKANKVYFNILRRKSCRTKEIVKQSRFNYQGREFHSLITVKECSHLISISFLCQN